MQNRFTRVVILALFAMTSMLAIAQAGKDETKDWQKVKTKDGALTLSFPKGWIVADDKDPEFQKNLEVFRKDNPKIADMMSAKNNFALMMFDLNDSVDDLALDNMNVIIQKDPGLTPAMYPAVADEMRKSMEFKGKMEHKTVDTVFGKTLTYWGTVKIKDSVNGDRAMDLIGYMAVKSGKMIVISFSTGEGQLKDKRKTFDKIIGTGKM